MLKGAKSLFFLSVSLLVGCIPATRRVHGLNASVKIVRDENGVPHIRADNYLDAFYALGYAHAQDRLWQMELNRRIGAGRLSEILGTAAIAQDKFTRTWGFYKAAEGAVPALSAKSKAILESYAAGVNAFIKEDHLPLEFTLVGAKPEPWQIIDSLVWAKMLAYILSENWEDEIKNSKIADKFGLEALDELVLVYPKYGPSIIQLDDYKGPIDYLDKKVNKQNILIRDKNLLDKLGKISEMAKFSDDKKGLGSNNWVISGVRTVTGKPILANDPHLMLQSPSLWYFADIQGGDFAVMGATLPGIPMVAIGQNKRIAWGITNTAPDTQDLFILDLKENSYITPNGPVSLRNRQEIIKIKGQTDVVLNVRESEYGPIISDLVTNAKPNLQENQAVAINWVQLKPNDTTFNAFLGINQANNWSEFRQALKDFVGPMSNFVYADVDGNIGYIAPGKVPIRDWDGRLPAKASLGHHWSGYIPLESLPQVFNPREGFIVTANNQPLPYGAPEFTVYNSPYRAARIRELILSNPKLAANDMSIIQNDTLSIPARELIPGLLKLTAKSSAAKQLQDVVRKWDFKADLNSIGSTAFAFYYRELAKIVQDETGELSDPLLVIKLIKQNNNRWCDDIKTKEKEDCQTVMSNALEKGAIALEEKLGNNPDYWRWEKVKKTSIEAILGKAPIAGPLFNRVLPAPGSIATVNVSNYNQETFVNTQGASLRFISDLNDINTLHYIYPMGQSGDLFSKFYDNQLLMWRDDKILPLSSDLNQWQTKETIELVPTI